MELMLKNGDYVPNGVGGLRRVFGKEELLQRVLFKLTARRGMFPFREDLGSRLWQLGRLPVAQRLSAAEQYVIEALADEAGLAVESVDLTAAVTACTNPAAFTGGSDEEDDETLRARVLESYQRLPNGANTAWYEQTAMSHSGVTAAQAVGRARGIGTVDVYIAGESGVPTEALVAEVQADLAEKREIAVDVAMKAPTATAVDVTVAVAPREGADSETVLQAVETAIAGFFTGRLLGGAVRLAELGSRVYGQTGVENYRFTAPASDIAAADGVLPVLGTLTVTEMEA